MASTTDIELRDMPVVGNWIRRENDLMNPPGERNERRTWRRAAHRAVGNAFTFSKEQKKYYYQNYTCVPNCKDQVGGPPIFIISITIIEIAFFIYYTLTSVNVTWWTISTEAINSPLIFSPYKRQEVWRFITYMFLHAGVSHILSNCIMQIIIGIPLELVHGSVRIMGIYIIGVLAGSLGSSVFDVGTYLVGASGGDFALMFAYLGNIIINWDSMKLEFAIGRLVAVLFIILTDFGFALYRRYGTFEESASRVSYSAHLVGAAAGLTMGIAILKNFKRQRWEDILLYFSVAIFALLVLLAIFFNIFCPCYERYILD